MAKKLKVNEKMIAEAIQYYLEDRGYNVSHLEMVHDSYTNEFYVNATVED